MKNDVAICVNHDHSLIGDDEVIYQIKKAGFNKVFLRWYNKKLEFSQEDQLELCRKLGLEIIFCHLGYKNIPTIWEEGREGDSVVEEFKKDIDSLSAHKIPMVIMHTTRTAVCSPLSQIGIERFKKIVNYAEKHNIIVALENTVWPGFLEFIFDHINSPNLKVCYDCGHDHCHFKDSFNFERFKNQIVATHIHDNDKCKDLHMMPFEGSINWDYVIKGLKTANYYGTLTAELCYTDAVKYPKAEDFYNEVYRRITILEKNLKRDYKN